MKNKTLVVAVISFVVLITVFSVLIVLYITRIRPEDIMVSEDDSNKSDIILDDVEDTMRSTAEVQEDTQNINVSEVIEDAIQQLPVIEDGKSISFSIDSIGEPTSDIDVSTIADDNMKRVIRYLAEQRNYTAVFSLDKMQTRFAFPNEDAIWDISVLEGIVYISNVGSYSENLARITSYVIDEEKHLVDLSGIDTSLSTEENKAFVAQYIYSASLAMEDPWSSIQDLGFDEFSGRINPSEYAYLFFPDGSVQLNFPVWLDNGEIDNDQPFATFNADRSAVMLSYGRNMNYINYEDFVLGRTTELISPDYNQ